MADQWEMCFIIEGGHEYAKQIRRIVIYSPLGKNDSWPEEFIKKYDPSFSRPVLKDAGFFSMDKENNKDIFNKEIREMVSRFWGYFMSEGWEPYSVTNRIEDMMIGNNLSSDLQSFTYLCFRKKYQG